MLTKIKINGLFNKFNYVIELKKEDITILTGPNGYGKTTILKIIHAFAIKNMAFFFQLPFTEITLSQTDNDIVLSKSDDIIEIKSKNEKPIRYKKNDIVKPIRRLLESSPYRQTDENHWLDRRTGVHYSTENLINQLIETDPEFIDRYYKKQIPDFVNVYLIREQRLIRKAAVKRRRNPPFFYEEELREGFSNTVEEYANELSQNIKDILADASKIGQELDSSFPRRLFDEAGQVHEDEFNIRYNIIKEKQKSLSMYGLSAIDEDTHTSFKEENAKALLVYLNDTEKKLAVFDDILQKLEVFSTIINNRQFVHKQLEISPDFGFKFKTEDGKELALTNLSSGEQQEVVLLYELLFKVAPATLVLIDEPEISLHVAWQKEVLDDIIKIIKIQKIAVITATHSPQIIGEHWDLVVDLWDLLEESSK